MAEPRARYLTRFAAAYLRRSACKAVNDHTAPAWLWSSTPTTVDLDDAPFARAFAQHDHRTPDGVGHRHASPLVIQTSIVDVQSALLDQPSGLAF